MQRTTQRRLAAGPRQPTGERCAQRGHAVSTRTGSKQIQCKGDPGCISICTLETCWGQHPSYVAVIGVGCLLAN
jgi:hypothetical protein